MRRQPYDVADGLTYRIREFTSASTGIGGADGAVGAGGVVGAGGNVVQAASQGAGAAGGNAPASTTSGMGGAGPCQSLAFGELTAWFASSETVGLNAVVGSNELRLVLHTTKTPGVGTYDLASAENIDPDQTKHEQWSFLLGQFAMYRAVAGTVELTTASSPLTIELVGTLSNLHLVELDDAGDVVVGGDCIDVATVGFDTVVPLGTSCASAYDCGDTETKVCDPSTLTCVESCYPVGSPPCTGATTCASLQTGWQGDTAACYQPCDAFTAQSCPTGMGCGTFDPDTGNGYCMLTGAAASGQLCGSVGTSGLTTFCSDADATCKWWQSSTSSTCGKICDHFAADPGCPGTDVCQPNGVCAPPANPPPPALGETCAFAGFYCELDSDRYHGKCIDEGGSAVCRQLCSFNGGPACPQGLSCGFDMFFQEQICQ